VSLTKSERPFPALRKTQKEKARTEVTVCTDDLIVTVFCSAVSERLNHEVARPAYSIRGSRVCPPKRHKTPRIRHPPWPPCDVFFSAFFVGRINAKTGDRSNSRDRDLAGCVCCSRVRVRSLRIFYPYLCDGCDLCAKNLRPPDQREIPTEGGKDHKDPMAIGYRENRRGASLPVTLTLHRLANPKFRYASPRSG
jgi:hypothetical protein